MIKIKQVLQAYGNKIQCLRRKKEEGRLRYHENDLLPCPYLLEVLCEVRVYKGNTETRK